MDFQTLILQYVDVERKCNYPNKVCGIMLYCSVVFYWERLIGSPFFQLLKHRFFSTGSRWVTAVSFWDLVHEWSVSVNICVLSGLAGSQVLFPLELATMLSALAVGNGCHSVYTGCILLLVLRLARLDY